MQKRAPFRFKGESLSGVKKVMKKIVKRILMKLRLYDILSVTIYENRLLFKVLLCYLRYCRLLKLAKKKPLNEKIRVLFIVSEIAKWKEQSLYEEMEKSGDFYPIVGISAWNKQFGLDPDELDAVHKRAIAFFSRLGDRCVRTVTCENGKVVYHNLLDFNPDIVFYTEQWGPCPEQHPFAVSKYALTCFLPYYVPTFGLMSIDCYPEVPRMSWTYFCLGEKWKQLYQWKLFWMCHCNKFVVTGHPTLDRFYEQRDRLPIKGYVIYAPHFAFPHPSQIEYYNIGTFDWSGMPILQYAEAHPEIRWVFKPHPYLRAFLQSCGIMNKEEIDSYYERWEKLGIACYDSEYQELFLESRAMITDSGSFLSEYGATGRPLIRLICSADKCVSSRITRKMYGTYYQVRNLDELYDMFRMVIEQKCDPMKENRIEAIQRVGLANHNASQRIVSYLKNVFAKST